MRPFTWLAGPLLALTPVHLTNAAATPQPPTAATSSDSLLATTTHEAQCNPMDEIGTLFKSLELSGKGADTLKEEIRDATKDGGFEELKLRFACLVAKLAIGCDSVDTSPLNMTIVQENWSQACVAEPYCILEPGDTEEVSKAIKIIKFFKTKFSVRSGGHSPNPGWSSVDDAGILLDLRNLNGVSLSRDKKTASLGPGARWGEVIDTLEADKATVVGGRVPIVGVGGLMLGGGLHHVLAEYGTAADNVKNYEVVLSDGSIVDANAKENSDLFWALKGGGPNFGVVTRFDVYTIPVWEVWYEFRVYAVEDLPKVVDAYVKWQAKSSKDVKGTASLITAVDSITLLLQYSAPVERPKIFDVFYEMEPLLFAVPSTIGTFKSLTAILAGVTSPEPLRHDYRAISSRTNAKLLLDAYAYWKPKALAVREATGANQTFTIQPVSRNAAKIGAAKGGNAMNIPQEDHVWWTTLIDWRDAKDDELVRSVSIETTNNWKKLGKQRGLHLDYLFMNDASRDQNPLASYGAANLQKLKKVSSKYDKAQLFQKYQNGGFLLSAA